MRIRSLTLCALSLFFLAATAGRAVAQPSIPDRATGPCALSEPEPAFPLHTAGRYIVDNQGNRVKLHGVAWAGAEANDFVVGGLQLEPLQAIVHRIRCMGFNAVRLPWSNEMYESNPVVPDYAITANPQLKGMHAMAVYDLVVRSLAAQGLMVILDNHNSNAEWCCGDDGNDLWYNAEYPESSWIADWKGMVRQFRDVPQVIATDLRNEPRIDATWGGDPATDWHAAAERGGNAVLSVNPNLLLMVEGINYSLDLTGVATLPVTVNIAQRVVYSPHDYPFDHNGLTGESQLAAALDQQWGYILTPGQSYTAPLWLGEFGNCHTSATCITDTTSSDGSGGLWFASMRQYLSQNDIGWSYWELAGTESTGNTRTFGAEETYGVLNPYWNGPALTNDLPPAPLNTVGALQTIMQPNQGPGLARTYPPIATITQPLPGSTIASGGTLTLSADASLRMSSSDSIRAVDFFANGKRVATAATFPYTAIWPNIAPGQYRVVARVRTTNGAIATSQPVPVEAINYIAPHVLYSNAISINFVSYNATPMALSETAGVVPQSNWNQAAIANSGEFNNLVDAGGHATAALVQWSAPNTYFTSAPDQPGNDRMMRGYLDNANTIPNTETISGLPSSFRLYDVIVYFDGGNGASPGSTRSANYRLTAMDSSGRVHGCAGQTREGSTISGTDSGGVDFSGTFIQASAGSAGNYVEFSNCTGSSFALAPIHGGSTDNQVRAPINGIQILAH